MFTEIVADVLLEINLGENDDVCVVSDMNLVLSENRVFMGFRCVWEGKPYNIILRMTLDKDVLRLECCPPSMPDMSWWDYSGYQICLPKAGRPRKKHLGFKFYTDYIQKALYRGREWMNAPENADRIKAWKRTWSFKDN